MIFDYNVNTRKYSNLPELIFNICDSISLPFIITRSIDIKEEKDNSELSENYLVFNADNGVIDNESILYIQHIKDAINYDYFIYAESGIQIKIPFKILFFYIGHYSIVITSLVGLFISLFYSFNMFHITLFLQSIVIYLLFNLSFENSSDVVSKVCKIGSESNTCIKLQKRAGLIFNYFTWAEMGLLYFYTLFIWTFLLIILPKASFINFALLSIGLIFIFYKSIIEQIKQNIYCPVCLVTDIVILFHLIYVSYTLAMNNNWQFIITDCVLLFISFIIVLSAIIQIKRTSYFKSVSFDSEYIVKDLIVKNANLLPLNFHSSKDQAIDLFHSSFNFESYNSRKKILICISLNCPSCISLAHKLRYINHGKINIGIFFQIDNLEKYTLKDNPLLENIYLAHIIEKLGVLDFSNAISQATLHGNKIKYYESFLKSNNLKLNNVTGEKLFQQIVAQNDIITDRKITTFPYVLYNDKLIPSYIEPRFYYLIC